MSADFTLNNVTAIQHNLRREPKLAAPDAQERGVEMRIVVGGQCKHPSSNRTREMLVRGSSSLCEGFLSLETLGAPPFGAWIGEGARVT
ncbi:MAG: hypothetical protein WA005_14140 [Candidatus Binataceae bacterium]